MRKNIVKKIKMSYIQIIAMVKFSGKNTNKE